MGFSGHKLTLGWRQAYGHFSIVHMVLGGSIAVAVTLTALLLAYDTLNLGFLRPRTYFGIFTIAYLLIAFVALKLKHRKLASWLVIIAYLALTGSIMFYWGLGSTAGAFISCFVVILPGVLLGSKYIPPVSLLVVLITIAVFAVPPELIGSTYKQHIDVSLWDVATYATIISIFSLVSWISRHQTEQSLIRAHKAERQLRKQNINVTEELKRTRQKRNRDLYLFALLGQSSAATLHELSSQLSILNLDIEDISQHTKNKRAIKSARDTIKTINSTVKIARRQLGSGSSKKIFSVAASVLSTIQEIKPSFTKQKVKLIINLPKDCSNLSIKGSPTALSQVISVLLNNAAQASKNSGVKHPWVKLTMEKTSNSVIISVLDSGPGIISSRRSTIFEPRQSSKIDGLGMGLYIAKMLTINHLGGDLRLETPPKERGANFILEIPYEK